MNLPRSVSRPALGSALIISLLLASISPTRVSAAAFVRGDLEADGSLGVSDAIAILGRLFLGGTLPHDCDDAADVNDSGTLDISDPVYLLVFAFVGGREPPAPFPECGDDPTADGLECRSYAPCPQPTDTEPPVFLPQGCTEIACAPTVTMEIGSAYDMLSVDACNWCSPIPIEDNVGVARVDLQLFDATVDVDPPEILFEVTLEVSPPARSIELGPDRFAPEDLILPQTLHPGQYIRRIVASDAAGNFAINDREVTLVDPEPEVVRSDKERDLSPDATADEVAELVAGNTAFALDLYDALRGRDGNLFFSPYSISSALAMTYAGARGETARQMASTLHFTLAGDRLHTALNALDLALVTRGADVDVEGDPFKLHVANALWGQRGFPFLEEFLDVLAVNYGAGLRPLDFVDAPDASRLEINRWVEDQTEGRIVDLLPPGVITALTRLVLTNAIYFKASWRTPFFEELTAPKPFHLLDGSEVTVPTMSVDAEFNHYRANGFHAVELPYVGEQTSMVIIVPDAGRFDEIESSLDAARLSAIFANLSETRLLLSMPKFRFEFTLPVKAALIELGMTDAFQHGVADLSGIDGTRDLFIHDVLHKAFIGVDEKGTEAAAATAVLIGVVSVPPILDLDRPFIFVIRDVPTNGVLFAGRLLDPTR